MVYQGPYLGEVVFHFGRFPVWSSSILVCSNLGRLVFIRCLPFWLSWLNFNTLWEIEIKDAFLKQKQFDLNYLLYFQGLMQKEIIK